MKKTAQYMMAAVFVFVAVVVFGCGEDEYCYTPPPQTGGVGGGPIVSGPTGGFGDAPGPKPQGAGGTDGYTPCGEEKAYRCTYHYKPGDIVCTSAGKSYACAGSMTVFAASKPAADKKCQSYASTHASTCDNNCASDDDGRRLWECNGTATCTASGKPDTKCDYKEELVLASSKTEAADILVDSCATHTNPGYTCKNKNIKCFDPDSN